MTCANHLSQTRTTSVVTGSSDFVISHVALGSYPISNLKGDVFVVTLYHVLCVNSATGKYSAPKNVSNVLDILIVLHVSH